MSQKKWLLLGILALLAAIAVLLLLPNPLRASVLAEAKYRGYLAYTTEEAVSMAYGRCVGCHSAEKMLKYCARCGPPFIVVTHTMKKYVELSKPKRSDLRQFSDAELVAITQVWNALVGNWEAGWGEKNLKKLLQGDQALISLLEKPTADRPIENALQGRRAPGAYLE